MAINLNKDEDMGKDEEEGNFEEGEIQEEEKGDLDNILNDYVEDSLMERTSQYYNLYLRSQN